MIFRHHEKSVSNYFDKCVRKFSDSFFGADLSWQHDIVFKQTLSPSHDRLRGSNIWKELSEEHKLHQLSSDNFSRDTKKLLDYFFSLKTCAQKIESLPTSSENEGNSTASYLT